MISTNIKETVFANYYCNSIKNLHHFLLFRFQNTENQGREIYNFFNKILTNFSENITVSNESILFVESATGDSEYLTQQSFIKEGPKTSANIGGIVFDNISMKLKLGKAKVLIDNMFIADYNDNPVNKDNLKNISIVVFNLDVFSPFLPINPKTYKYDLDSKFPNPDWEENTKIMYQILKYPLENFKFVEAYRHVKDTEFEYYKEEQLQANLRKYTGS